jgi:hypothetical protein
MIINLKVGKHIYNFFLLILSFYFFIFLEIHYLNYQKDPLSTDLFSNIIAELYHQFYDKGCESHEEQ